LSLCSALLLAGCIDFVEPDLPERGAPAIVQVNVVVADSGWLSVNGMLVPGLHESGLRRGLLREALRVAGLDIEPSTIERNGTRRFDFSTMVARDLAAGPIDVEGPRVEGVTAPPAVRWLGIRRLDPDSMVLMRGADLSLHVTTTQGSTPPPDIRQWFLTLDGPESDFRVSADGPPPDTIVIPAHWIPAGTRIQVRLAFIQAVRIGNNTNYVGLITLDTRVHWILNLNTS
jgi:hypothetical protein